MLWVGIAVVIFKVQVVRYLFMKTCIRKERLPLLYSKSTTAYRPYDNTREFEGSRRPCGGVDAALGIL